MTAAFDVGAVLHWKDFTFEDGTTKNKYFVVLGAKPASDCLMAIATSQPKRRSYQPGCHANEGYFHIPGGSKDYFPKDTWLLLMEFQILRLAEVVSAGVQKVLTVEGTLRQQLANEIRNCLRRIDDVSQAQLDLL